MGLTQVSTDGVKNDAITKTKIPANQIEASELADNAVDTNAIVDNAVNMNKLSDLDNGRIIARVSGGAGNPEAATAAQIRTLLNVADGATNSPTTTINGNSDHRIVTATGTANTLQGESTFIHDVSTYDTTIQHNVNTSNDLIIQNDNSGTAAGARFTLQSGSNANTGPQEQFKVGSHSWLRQVPKSSGNMTLAKNGVTHTTFDANGHISISDGNLNISTSGHGIDFSSTSNSAVGSNISELLTDYEEGTWVPQLIRNGGSSYFSVGSGNRYGYYKRVGNLLWLAFYWYNPSLSDSANQYWIIQGLPFGVKTGSGGAYQFLPGGYYYMMGNATGDSVSNGSYRWQSNSNGLVLYSADNNMNANGAVEFSGCGTLCTA